MPMRLITRLTCYFMAMLLLLSSTGFVLVEHLCQMGGKSQSLWVGKETCKKSCSSLSPKSQPSTFGPSFEKQPCCKETSSLSRLEVETIVGSTELPTPAASLNFFIPQTGTFLLLGWSTWLSIAKVPPHPQIPHSQAGRYLALLCAWLL